MLKAYMVHDGCPEERAALVFASNNQQARKTGNNCDGIGEEGYFSVRANRLHIADKYVSKEQKIEHAYIESKSAILRQAGWKNEGDQECAHCGLSEMDGEFPVCPECDSCPDCGHMEKCPVKTETTQNHPSLTP